MKILLLGKNGQVGWELQRSLAPLGDIVACDFDSPPPLKADFAQPELLAALVRSVRPDLIVNAAAHTAVDKAESEPELARAINAVAPGVLAREAAALGAVLVHYSTDYVFDGSGNMPRNESALTGPLSVYGRTKLEGERLVSRQRLPPPDPAHQLGLFGSRRQLRAHDAAPGGRARRAEGDRRPDRCPTGAELLADVTAHALRAVDADPARCGLYHCAASDETSWHGYARFVIEWACARGHALKVAPRCGALRAHARLPHRGGKAAQLSARHPAAAADLWPGAAALAARRRAHAQ